MSFADDYARFEESLQSDPDYARIDAECTRLQKIVNHNDRIGDSAASDYDKWNACEEALNKAAFDCSCGNESDADSELKAEYLNDGEMHIQRLRREAMIVAGEAFKFWIEATDQLHVAKSDRQARRSALVDTWNEIKAAKKEAAQ
mgnify:CR=1 FL=1|tara:strand:- start:260 stop:694 length:435 start_codon:yes stop_codon:yes gene_type:complete